MKKKVSFHVGYPDKEDDAPIKIHLGVPLHSGSKDRRLGFGKVLRRSILLFLFCVAAAIVAMILFS